MKETIEGYHFDFPKATSISKFDDPKTHQMSHTMKAVDVLIEMPECRIFIEIKNYEAHREWKGFLKKKDEEREAFLDHLRFSLKYKYRDSFLYQRCQNEEENKKSIFVFLTDWSNNSQINTFQNALHWQSLFPTQNEKDENWGKVWKRTFVADAIMVNDSLWNKTEKLRNYGTIQKA